GALEKALREAEEEKVQLNSQLAAQVEKVAALNASIVELKIEAAQGQVVSDSLKNVAHQLIAGPDLATACAEVASLAEYRSELEMKPAELTMRLRAKIGDMQVRLQVEEHTNVRLKAQITRMNARAAADTEAKIDGPNLELTQEVQRLERTRLAEEITRLEKKLVEEAAARSTLQTELDHARDRLLEMHAAQARAEEAKARRENEEREEKETLQQQLASVTKSAEDSESVLSLINPCGTKDGTHDHMVAFWNRLSETGEAIDPGEARAMRDQMERYEQVNQLYRQQLDGMQQEAAATAQRFDMERAVFIELVNSARAQVAALQEHEARAAKQTAALEQTTRQVEAQGTALAKALSAEPNIDAEAAKLVASLKEAQCPQCGKLLRDPHTLEKCSHTFCKTCILPVVLDSMRCPVCESTAYRRELHPSIPMRVLTDQLHCMMADH
ncbi:hypothetical protein CYMTET_3437, partial [Cymbomonas tetramitiformis]